MPERYVGLAYIKESEPEVGYWRINRFDSQAEDSDEDAIHAINHDGFTCIEQSLGGASYRVIGKKEAAEKWPRLFHFFQTAPEIIAPDPNSSDTILRDFYTMTYKANYASQPGIQPSEAEMMGALYGLFSSFHH